MHEYYRKNRTKLKKTNIKPIAKELEQLTGKSLTELWEEIWQSCVIFICTEFERRN